MRPGPDWLNELQRRFGAALRTPLDRGTGTLRTTPGAYDATLCAQLAEGPQLSSRERLAIYNRQYWFRLFGVLQGEYPLTAALLGYWRFNDYAARSLSESPPRGFDLHDAAAGFNAFLARELPPSVRLGPDDSAKIPRQALVEAAAIDAAIGRALYAAEGPRLDLTGCDAGRFARGRLRPTAGLTLLCESWPLLALRRTLGTQPVGARVALPPRLVKPSHWVIFHSESGSGQLALSAQQAQLFSLLLAYPVAEALARLEASCPPQERSALPARVRAWLAQSSELGFFSALQEQDENEVMHRDKDPSHAL